MHANWTPLNVNIELSYPVWFLKHIEESSRRTTTRALFTFPLRIISFRSFSNNDSKLSAWLQFSSAALWALLWLVITVLHRRLNEHTSRLRNMHHSRRLFMSRRPHQCMRNSNRVYFDKWLSLVDTSSAHPIMIMYSLCSVIVVLKSSPRSLRRE